jgi:hypothetical protein
VVAGATITQERKVWHRWNVVFSQPRNLAESLLFPLSPSFSLFSSSQIDAAWQLPSRPSRILQALVAMTIISASHLMKDLPLFKINPLQKEYTHKHTTHIQNKEERETRLIVCVCVHVSMGYSTDSAASSACVP